MVSSPDVGQIFKSRLELVTGSAVEMSSTSDVLQKYKEDALDSAGQEVSLAGDREDLEPDLVIPQSLNRRDDEQQLEPSCSLVLCCCRPDLGSASREAIEGHAAPPLGVINQVGFQGIIIAAIQMLVDSKSTEVYFASLSQEGRQAVCGLLGNYLQAERAKVPIFAASCEMAEHKYPVVAEQEDFHGTISEALLMLMEAKTSLTYTASLSPEGKQAVFSLLDHYSAESNPRAPESPTSSLQPSNRRVRGVHPYLEEDTTSLRGGFVNGCHLVDAAAQKESIPGDHVQGVADPGTNPSWFEQEESWRQVTSRKHQKYNLKKPWGAKG